jgi:hypothetical protein
LCGCAHLVTMRREAHGEAGEHGRALSHVVQQQHDALVLAHRVVPQPQPRGHLLEASVRGAHRLRPRRPPTPPSLSPPHSLRGVADLTLPEPEP